MLVEIVGEGRYLGNSFRISLSQIMSTGQLGRSPFWNKSKSAIALLESVKTCARLAHRSLFFSQQLDE